jgi:hypothetical protein
MPKKKGADYRDDDKKSKKEKGTSKAESFAAHRFKKGGKGKSGK